MKKAIHILALATIAIGPLQASAQYLFPLAELQKLCTKNSNDFETVALTNDYSVQSKLSSPTAKVYWSDKAGAAGKKYSIVRSQVPGSMVKIDFTTTDKKYYIELKGQLAAAGYKFVKEENKLVNGVQSVCNNYANGKFQVSVYNYTIDEPWYGVQIHL